MGEWDGKFVWRLDDGDNVWLIDGDAVWSLGGDTIWFDTTINDVVATATDAIPMATPFTDRYAKAFCAIEANIAMILFNKVLWFELYLAQL